MKKAHSILSFACLLFVAFPGLLFAQDSTAVAAATKPSVPEIFFEPTFYMLAGLFLIMLITIIALTGTIATLTKNMFGVNAEIKSEKEIAKNPVSLWARFDRKYLTKAVPLEKEKDILFEHGYDGIHELDNDLPPWWKYGFYMTILFAVLYLLNYHVFKTGDLQLAEYKKEVATADQQQAERRAKMKDLVDEDNVVYLADAASITKGKETFTTNCLACHGASGEGLVGPNLTDDYWLHGGGIKNIFKTITNGVPAKGMISWKAQLSPKQIQEVASFVISIHGTNPPNGKEPQGEKWIDPNAPKTDSTAVANSTDTKK